MNKITKKVGVIGAGSFGSALAAASIRAGNETWLWGRNKAQIQEINDLKTNAKYFGTLKLPDSLKATNSLNDLHRADLIILALPSKSIRVGIHQVIIHNLLNRPTHVLIGAKGIEANTLNTLDEIILEEYNKNTSKIHPDNFHTLCALSGPSFAKEILSALPTAVVIAGHHKRAAKNISDIMWSKNFRTYISGDIRGVELGGALKNVIAIACGVVDGLELGLNARASILTRGLNEIKEIVLAMGGELNTIYGLSGLGDMLLTATGNLSRNKRFGEWIGKGCGVEEALGNVQQVVEGYHTTEAAYQLALKYNIRAPIIKAQYEVLFNHKEVLSVMDKLISNQPDEE